MVDKGYAPEFAERIFKQIEGFGEYGFPESHAASFALLVYVSAWLKCHHPDAFLAALLNSQPMGFYAPAQLVRDAREHGVDGAAGRRDVQRLGTARSKAAAGCAQALAAGQRRYRCRRQRYRSATAAPRCARCAWVSAASAALPRPRPSASSRRVPTAPFASAEDLARRAGLDAHDAALLAQADALRGLAGHRHQAAWAVAGVDTRATPLLRPTRTHEAAAELAAPERRRPRCWPTTAPPA